MGKSVAELLEHISECSSQIVGGSCGKAGDHQSANQRHRTVARKRRSQVAYEFETCIEF